MFVSFCICFFVDMNIINYVIKWVKYDFVFNVCIDVFLYLI